MIEKFGPSSTKEVKKDLLKSFLETSTNKIDVNGKRKKPTDVTVNLSWNHYDEIKKKYTQVRNGGGKRSQKVTRDATLNDLLQLSKSLFFPAGKSSKGNISHFNCMLAGVDFSEIESTIFMNFNGIEQEVDFSIDNYIEKFGLKSPKFYLLTKVKSVNSFMKSIAEKASSDDDCSDDDFQLPPFPSVKTQKKNVRSSVSTHASPYSSSNQSSNNVC